MEKRYLKLLSKEYPTIESVASEMVNLSSIRSLPKGTEYFFSDLHGEYESFLHMLRSASGKIRQKIDLVFSKTVSAADRETLAKLIYYPETEIKKLAEKDEITDEWRRLTIYRLVLICEVVSAKFTRSKVRKRVPKDLVYVLDELLNVTDDINKDFYYDEIINSIIDTGIAESFIISLCNLIQSMAIDRLHIIGDIFDRGPRADIILDALIKMHDVDIQWGNHDISWMGAAAGNKALVANVIRIAMRYNTFDVLEDGYGLNLRALAVFASEVYSDDDCKLFYPKGLDDNVYAPVDMELVAKMHKAIAIIQFKLEGQLIEAHPEWDMDDRAIFKRVDFKKYTLIDNGKEYQLIDRNFPTVNPENPCELTEKEKELVTVLANSFKHSTKLQYHMKYLLSHGSMYKVCNGNLMFHGCIPMEKDESYASVNINGAEYKGKELFDKIDEMVDAAFFDDSADHEYAKDFIWYLWSGPKSPLFGKDKMAFFERTFVKEKELHVEVYNDYYRFSEREDVCIRILADYGIDSSGHIINGHVPVKIKDGESPVRAGGKLFVIDGGISKAYQSTTGIAGYTLIYDSHSLCLAEHQAFVPGEAEHSPLVKVVEETQRRINVADTDIGYELGERIKDLRGLLTAYRKGDIKERT